VVPCPLAPGGSLDAAPFAAEALAGACAFFAFDLGSTGELVRNIKKHAQYDIAQRISAPELAGRIRNKRIEFVLTSKDFISSTLCSYSEMYIGFYRMRHKREPEPSRWPNMEV
jgi:hypothetical protein